MMKKDEILVLGLSGVAVLLILKASGVKMPFLDKLTVSATGTAGKFLPWNPPRPNSGTPYNPADPAAPIGVAQLVNGTIADYFNQDRTSYSTPTTTAIIDDVLSDTYGTAAPSRSVVYQAGRSWW